MATIREVAAQAGVSVATVSYVVNRGPRAVSDGTRARVLEAIEALHYRPNLNARRLARRQTRTLALAMSRTPKYIFSDPYFPELFLGVSEAATLAGYTLTFVPSNSDSADPLSVYREALFDRSVDGVLIGMVDFAVEEWLSSTLTASSAIGSVPFVLLGGVSPECAFPAVDYDDAAGTYAATSHLIGLGHRRIGFISGPTNGGAGLSRLSGYRRALQHHGLAVEDALVEQGHWTQDGGEAATRRLLAMNPTALVAANDVMALGALRTLRSVGRRVPRDVALIGYDGRFSEHVDPPLTAVRLPAYDLGVRGTQLLIDLIEGRAKSPQKVVLPVELVLRESCGRLLVG